MLKEAAMYKEEIRKEIEKMSDEDMVYLCGSSNVSNIELDQDGSYAILNSKEEVIGAILYDIDSHIDMAYHIRIASFSKGNPTIGKEVYTLLEQLVRRHHIVEWRAVSGNPACRAYDCFIKKHNGNKHVLKDRIKENGIYHDSIIYEIVNQL